MKLPAALEQFVSKLNHGQMDLSKDGLSKLFSKKEVLYNEDGTPLEEPALKKPFKLPKALALDVRFKEAPRYFSGSIFEKVLMTFDKSTLAIIGVAWLAAMIAVAIAFVSVKEMSQLKLKIEIARALDPVLPKIVRAPLSKDDYAPLLARLKKQFPAVNIEITNKPTLRIQSNNPDDFITWLNAISYTDSMVSTVRWTISSFCVGSECTDNGVMQAELAAEKINITQPEEMTP
ncbi:MAG: hypothetical protein EB059_06065 [Alphaproteobacteria bacterium]|nr:hypothetical protein [Alphaproteobacteria bacterium]